MKNIVCLLMCLFGISTLHAEESKGYSYEQCLEKTKTYYQTIDEKYGQQNRTDMHIESVVTVCQMMCKLNVDVMPKIALHARQYVDVQKRGTAAEKSRIKWPKEEGDPESLQFWRQVNPDRLIRFIAGTADIMAVKRKEITPVTLAAATINTARYESDTGALARKTYRELSKKANTP